MFEKLFAKKPKEKTIQKFWKEFEDRAELYADILAEGDEESEDFLWMRGLVGKALKLCCIDSDVGYSFGFDLQRDPVCLVFHHLDDEYLKQVAALLQKHYPPSLEGTVGLIVEK